MRQDGEATITPVAFFALVFLFVAGTLPTQGTGEPHRTGAPLTGHGVRAPSAGHQRARPGRRTPRSLSVLGAPRPWETGPLAGVEPAAGLPSWAATAAGVTLTGGALWWYGVLWPRRTPSQPIGPGHPPDGRRRPGRRL
ncbi:hypothetical protein [Streptosporangium sp. NPDC020145]|uniref:hypothetical protein n=1 Tax=Streptosporangium sp. NPDC020145 TaxID=3154694 RepID=UPI0034163E7A